MTMARQNSETESFFATGTSGRSTPPLPPWNLEPCRCKRPEWGLLENNIYVAACQGRIKKTESWLSGSDGDVDLADDFGQTLLHGAAGSGQDGLVCLLLQKYDPHLNTRDIQGNTPLICAATKGHVDAVHALLETDTQCVIDHRIRNELGRTALDCAAERQHWDIIMILIRTSPHNLENLAITFDAVMKQQKWNVLHEIMSSAVENQNYGVVDDILSAGVTYQKWNVVRSIAGQDFNFKLEILNKTITCAIYQEEWSVVQALLLHDRQFDADVLDVALVAAAKSQKWNVVNLILSQDYTHDSKALTSLLSLAAENNQITIARLLLLGNKTKHLEISSPLIESANHGRLLMLETLLECCDYPYDALKTALIAATQNGKWQAIGCILYSLVTTMKVYSNTRRSDYKQARLKSETIGRVVAGNNKVMKHILEQVKENPTVVSKMLLLVTCLEQWQKVQLLLHNHLDFDTRVLSRVLIEAAAAEKNVIVQHILLYHNIPKETLKKSLCIAVKTNNELTCFLLKYYEFEVELLKELIDVAPDDLKMDLISSLDKQKLTNAALDGRSDDIDQLLQERSFNKTILSRALCAAVNSCWRNKHESVNILKQYDKDQESLTESISIDADYFGNQSADSMQVVESVQRPACLCPQTLSGTLPEDVQLSSAVGDVTSVRAWLRLGGDINNSSCTGWTLLTIACANGQLSILDTLLQHSHIHLNPRTAMGQTPLLLAARWGHTEAIRNLRTASITHCKLNMQAEDHEKQTALILAALYCQWDVVHCLLDEDVEWNSEAINTTLRLALDENEWNTVSLILAQCQGFQRELLQRTLKDSVTHEETTVLGTLLQRCHQDYDQESLHEALSLSTKRGEWELAQHLLTLFQIFNQEIMTRSYIYSNTCEVDESMEKLLDLAVKNYHWDLVTGLLENYVGFSEDLLTKTLKASSECHMTRVAKILLDRHRWQCDSRTMNTVLTRFLQGNCWVIILKLLQCHSSFEMGILDATMKMAAEQKQWDVVKCILSGHYKGYSYNYKTLNTVLSSSLEEEEWEILEQLVYQYKDLDHKTLDVTLKASALANRWKLVKAILQSRSCSYSHDALSTTLAEAAKNEEWDIIIHLLNIPQSYDTITLNSIMLKAASKNQVCVSTALLKHHLGDIRYSTLSQAREAASMVGLMRLLDKALDARAEGIVSKTSTSHPLDGNQ